ncbi:hypothetical protein JAO76_14205 [Pontibacter sp. BT310]|jgi:hypothetical protein|uniref:YcxB-like protein domain-containing protein n=1 Tax=Pontibacter populi TaxID=890055 RepID=A0ABS6XE98_9BACT|nr:MULTISPECIES: hypothetical protein [Pontibacter]MBJ6119358.1 hypothetical protein [Pontibacter sp. BT310]MBR0571786.1 hypothetical protein [Microvirga sp. STS03]MBW3366212.1 hypothetical protein [Pontibacter populi]
MQNINIRLFEGAFTGNLKAEQRTNLLTAFLLLLQIGLLLYLVLTKGFSYSFVGIYLLHLLVFPFLVARIWLDLHPEYRRHLTLTDQGVRYRKGFRKKEQDFDWEEVDEVYLSIAEVVFVLKNEERHLVRFNMLHSNTALHRARQTIQHIVQQKGITLTVS